MHAVTRAESAWGIDSEYGRLHDVLLCPPDNFRWLPTSAISRGTLASGRAFDPAQAARQHAEMVAVYAEAGVRVHFLEPDPALPYQVFARDSSVMTPGGGIVTQLHQWWRRGEYAPVIRFYQANEIPLREMVTAAALEGGDFIVVEPGAAIVGSGEERTQEPAARQLAGWLEADGWEVRIERIPAHYVHLDVLMCVLGERLAAVCVDAVSSSLLRWLEAKRVEIVPVSPDDALGLGVNGVCLGDERVLSNAASKDLNTRLRALGVTVYDPDLSAFTLGGGGAHCLMQALRREPAG
jgi:N-dimethylarginine dimethylaminohydrolase